MSVRMLFYALGLFLISSSCNDDDEVDPGNDTENDSLNKIMPLGASRVEGARPSYESYRYELWRLLIDDGREFDFLGTMNDRASYPDYRGMSFDADHEGRGGFTSGELLNGLRGWLEEAGTPDIVLFSAPGGNDALTGMPFDDAVSNVTDIIDILQETNPEVTIIIEQLAPGSADLMTAELTVFFTQMQEAVVSIAAEQTTTSSRVVTVDMATGFNDTFLADDVHYNEAGASFVATRYYEVLVDLLE